MERALQEGAASSFADTSGAQRKDLVGLGPALGGPQTSEE